MLLTIWGIVIFKIHLYINHNVSLIKETLQIFACNSRRSGPRVAAAQLTFRVHVNMFFCVLSHCNPTVRIGRMMGSIFKPGFARKPFTSLIRSWLLATPSLGNRIEREAGRLVGVGIDHRWRFHFRSRSSLPSHFLAYRPFPVQAMRGPSASTPSGQRKGNTERRRNNRGTTTPVPLPIPLVCTRRPWRRA